MQNENPTDRKFSSVGFNFTVKGNDNLSGVLLRVLAIIAKEFTKFRV